MTYDPRLLQFLGRKMSIFTNPEHDRQWLREELSAIRSGIAQNTTELAAIKTELRSIHSEQDRFELKLEKHDEILRDLRNNFSVSADFVKRFERIETDVSELKNWKTEKGAAWNGPQMAIAAIAALTPILGGIWIIIQVFERTS